MTNKKDMLIEICTLRQELRLLAARMDKIESALLTEKLDAQKIIVLDPTSEEHQATKNYIDNANRKWTP